MCQSPSRVAEITVYCAGGEDKKGSGYLLDDESVLTAAHVLDDAVAVRVRFNPDRYDEREPHVRGWRRASGCDIAVIDIEAISQEPLERVAWGRVSDDSSAVLSATIMGFPLFKLRQGEADGSFRDMVSESGFVPVAANRREGTLSFILSSPPPPDPDLGAHRSPWEGMSGAAVWTNGFVIGVVARQELWEGTGRLVVERTAFSGLGELVGDTGLASPPIFPDVVPREASAVVRAAYWRQVRRASPQELIGRAADLEKLTEFCAGTEPFLRIEADYRSGKTAMAAWFATHPPAGVDVVSFLITRRAGQADSNSFLSAMIDQLGQLSTRSEPVPIAPVAQLGMFEELLDDAAASVTGRGRRLVLVIDGLDEDVAGAAPVPGTPTSIMSQLPDETLPDGVRIILLGRPHPGLPDDLPSAHAIRSCSVWLLEPSPVAEKRGQEAERELRAIFARGGIGVDVVGFIIAAQGGLTTSDLVELSGETPGAIQRFLTSVDGRSFETRPGGDADAPVEDPLLVTHQLAHETLNIAAQNDLGHGMDRFRDRTHQWVAGYLNRKWPEETPNYCGGPYMNLLVALGDIERLYRLVSDVHRHAWLYRTTGSNQTALMEVVRVQEILSTTHPFDLSKLLDLAITRHELNLRGYSLPLYLPALWARLGRVNFAENLTRGSDPFRQAEQVAEIAKIIAATDHDRAEMLASNISDPYRRADALSAVAEEISRTNPDRARRVANEVHGPSARASALGVVAQIVAITDPDKAEVIASDIEDQDLKDKVLAGITEVVARTQPDRAEKLGRRIQTREHKDIALAAVASSLASTDLRRALKMIEEIEDLLRHAGAVTAVAKVVAATDPNRAYAIACILRKGWRHQALAEVVAVVATQDPDWAEALTSVISDSELRATSTAVIVRSLSNTDAQRAESMASAIRQSLIRDSALSAIAIALVSRRSDKAEAIARKMSSTKQLIEVARAMAPFDIDRAERLIGLVSDPAMRTSALIQVANVIASVDPERAENITSGIALPSERQKAMVELACTLAEVDPSRAETIVRRILDPRIRADAFVMLGNAVASTDHVRSTYFAHWAETAARDTVDPSLRLATITAVAEALAEVDPDHAETLASSIESSSVRARALSAVAGATATTDPDRAEMIANRIEESAQRNRALVTIAQVRAATDPDGAEILARSFPGKMQAQGLAAVAIALARIDSKRAIRLASSIDGPDRDGALSALAIAAASSYVDWALEVVQYIDTSAIRDRTLQKIVDTVALVDLSQAEVVAQAIEDQFMSLDALTTVAAKTALFDPERAQLITDEIHDPTMREWSKAAVSRAIARENQDLASSLSSRNPVTVNFALLASARSLATEDPHYAEILARSIADSAIQSQALTAVAEAIAESSVSRAVRIVRTIGDPATRADAMISILNRVAGQSDALEQALAAALTTDAWLRVLPKLIEVAPQLSQVLRSRYPIAFEDVALSES